MKIEFENDNACQLLSQIISDTRCLIEPIELSIEEIRSWNLIKSEVWKMSVASWASDGRPTEEFINNG